MVGYPRVPAGRLVVERSRRRSRGSARHQAPCWHSRVAAAPKSACALDGFGCPTEAPYGCFLPDLTRFGTCRHPNPSNALGARYILPAPAQWSKMPRGQRENHMSARQQKGAVASMRPRPISCFAESIQALRKRWEAKRRSTSTLLVITALKDNAGSANGCTGYDQPNDGQN